MTRKDLCKMCTEYSTDTKCENEEHCTMLKIFNASNERNNLKAENKRLKKEIKKREKELQEMKIRESWERFPDMMGK